LGIVGVLVGKNLFPYSSHPNKTRDFLEMSFHGDKKSTGATYQEMAMDQYPFLYHF